MKSVTTLVLALALPLGAPLSARGESITIPLSQPGKNALIEIDLINGSIEVIGEQRDSVLLDVRGAEEGGRRIVTPSGAKTIPLTSYAVEAEEDDNHVSISSDWNSQGMTIVARVPLQADLELSSVHGGTISVDSVDGRLELSHVHGGITAHNISGTVVAETVHGEISIELDRVTSNKPMAFTTVHGDIDLALPADFGADVSIDSRQNEIYSDFEVEVQPSNPRVRRDEKRRGVKFELEQLLRLKVNGGGTPIRIETLHGEVSLRKSEG